MEDLYCSLCQEKYDTRKRLPRLFPNCGHTFCSACIQSLIDQAEDALYCPEDEVECQFFNKAIGIGCFPMNFALHRMLTQKSSRGLAPKPLKPNRGLKKDECVSLVYCNDHSKLCDLICMTDRKLICTDCVLFGSHKKHHYTRMDDFGKEVRSKVTMLEGKTEIMKFKSFLNNSEKEIGSLKQKVEDKKRKLLSTAQDYADSIIEEVRMKMKEVEEDIEGRFSKFGYALNIIENTADRLKERQTSIDKTLNKVKSQVRKKDYDYGFLMNSLYAENNVFESIKELLDEVSQLEVNTNEVIDRELEKYSIEGQTDQILNNIQECVIVKYDDSIAAEPGEEKTSQQLAEDADQQTSVLTPNKTAMKTSIAEARDRSSSIPVSPDGGFAELQGTKSQNKSLISRNNNAEQGRSDVNVKNESISLIDVQMEELESNLFNAKSSIENTPQARSPSIIGKNDTSGKWDGLKKSSSFFKKDTFSKPLVSQTTISFTPDYRDKLSFNHPHPYQTQGMGHMADYNPQDNFYNSLYHKTHTSESMSKVKGSFKNTQLSDKQPSWTEGISSQGLNKLPRTSIRRPTLINRLGPLSNKQNSLESEIEVDLSRMNINDNTMPQVIAELAKNKRMKALNLSHNSITEIGFEQVLKKLATHPSLERVYLMNNYLDDSIFLRLEQWAKKLKKINYFNFQNCPQFKNMAKIKKYVNSLVKYGIKVDV